MVPQTEKLRAEDIITELFTQGDIEGIGSILLNGINNAIENINGEYQIDIYTNSLIDLENKFEEVIFDSNSNLADIADEYNHF